MNDSEFAALAEEAIDAIAEAIEVQDPEGEIDLDLNDNILTLVTEDGTFVINKQSAAKEIWLSSPITGPYHFLPKDGAWCSRAGDDLFKILSIELKMKISR